MARLHMNIQSEVGAVRDTADGKEADVRIIIGNMMVIHETTVPMPDPKPAAWQVVCGALAFHDMLENGPSVDEAAPADEPSDEAPAEEETADDPVDEVTDEAPDADVDLEVATDDGDGAVDLDADLD